MIVTLYGWACPRYGDPAPSKKTSDSNNFGQVSASQNVRPEIAAVPCLVFYILTAAAAFVNPWIFLGVKRHDIVPGRVKWQLLEVIAKCTSDI